MSEVPRDPFQHILSYDPYDFDSWKFGFRTALMLGNYIDILNGSETVLTGFSSSRQRASESDSSSAQAQLKAEDIFSARNATIYRVLVQSIMKCSATTEKGTALALIRKVTEGDGKAAYDALIQHHENPSKQNKMTAAKKFINEKMKLTDTVSSYKLRVGTEFQRTQELKVSMEDLKTTIFIDGLSADFDTLKPSLYAAQDITFEKASELALGHALHLESSKDEQRRTPLLQLAHQAQTVGTIEGGEDERKSHGVQLSHEEYAMVAAFRSGASKKRGGLDHDVDANPDTPTEYEKSLTCDNCRTKGHAKRTCKKRKALF